MCWKIWMFNIFFLWHPFMQHALLIFSYMYSNFRYEDVNVAVPREYNAIDTPNITSNKTRFIWRKEGNTAPQSA